MASNNNTNNIEMSTDRPEQDLNVLEANQKEVTPTIDAQAGVQKIEAVTLAWSKKSLYVALALYVYNCLFTLRARLTV